MVSLSQASALNPGSDLWVVADFDSSKWTAKLDWYLNFQILKASRRKAPELSPFLKEVMDQTGLQISQEARPQGPLLIHSEFHLPNRWVLVAPFNSDLKDWIKTVASVWTQLQQPSIRIFLPAGQNASHMAQAWVENLGFKDITLVLDLLQ